MCVTGEGEGVVRSIYQCEMSRAFHFGLALQALEEFRIDCFFFCLDLYIILFVPVLLDFSDVSTRRFGNVSRIPYLS